METPDTAKRKPTDRVPAPYPDRLAVAQPFDAVLGEQISRNGFSLLSVSLAQLATVSTLPFHHRDPFDRLLVAQAMVEQLDVVSVDDAFDAYGVRRLW